MKERERTCWSHRPPDHTSSGRPAAQGRTAKTVTQLIDQGVTQFVTGGALGFDTMAAEEVLRQRKAHPDIRLHLMMPCKGQEKKWRLSDRMRYQKIARQADEVTCLAEEYYDGCMLQAEPSHSRSQAPIAWSIAPETKAAPSTPPTERRGRAYI